VSNSYVDGLRDARFEVGGQDYYVYQNRESGGTGVKYFSYDEVFGGDNFNLDAARRVIESRYANSIDWVKQGINVSPSMIEAEQAQELLKNMSGGIRLYFRDEGDVVDAHYRDVMRLTYGEDWEVNEGSTSTVDERLDTMKTTRWEYEKNKSFYDEMNYRVIGDFETTGNQQDSRLVLVRDLFRDPMSDEDQLAIDNKQFLDQKRMSIEAQLAARGVISQRRRVVLPRESGDG